MTPMTGDRAGKAREAYLTIDDSPSPHTDALTAYLARHDIPALLFVRGDYLAENPEPVRRAIGAGLVVGNHTFHHRRASEMPLEGCLHEIERTETLIDAAYRQEGVPRPGKYFRFPHIDRGCAGFVVDYDAYPAHRQTLLRLFTDGLNTRPAPPGEEAREKKAALQSYLRQEGFIAPFSGVTFPWYGETEMIGAADCLYTYSSADWMLTKRHLARDWPYKTVADLTRRIDDDPWLADAQSRHVVLMHDQDEILNVTLALIAHMKDKGFVFIKPD